MNEVYQFDEIARLPLPGDNCAVATRQLDAGTVIHYEDQTLIMDYTVMEGHRFAVKTIAPGEELLSWELPFGVALHAIQPGHYVINEAVLDELRVRQLQFDLPAKPNFADQVHPYVLDEANFLPAQASPAYSETRTFMGYRRSEARGVGTRNHVVLLGTTSRTGSYVKQLAARLQGELKNYPNVDGIVPAAHTEGGTEKPNNLDLLLRTLAGFIVNPNVGAVLIADYGIEPVTNKMVEAYLREHSYPIDEVLHKFVSLQGSFEENLAKGETILREWLPTVNAMQRTPESISHLKIGLQCGGSDAFSGISANPLLGWLSEELVRYGGAASLAETDELIGAEPYVLSRVRNVETARKFLELVDRFKERTSWHGASAEGNPSGGNKYRGLYNIYLKSIGAARKKDPTTRLDYATEYGELMKDGGFYFMDSPGNDLESIAGQVAAGCNMIFFTTGNGSITNFPYVPTVKVVTTTRRFQLLSNDMDVNAGQFLEGTSMDELGKEAFELTIQIASGQRSVGEKAGHAQVQIWRNWRQNDASQLERLMYPTLPTGEPIEIPEDTEAMVNPIQFVFTRHQDRRASDNIGLILPTSLCSGQVANMITQRLNKQDAGQPELSRFVALAHTEGCGNSGGQAEQLYARTMIGYITHPMVKHCLLLEHGCEKTHNDYMRHQLEEMGVDASQLGFASIQLDGGITKVTQKVEAWFADQLAAGGAAEKEIVGLEGLRIGIASDGSISDEAGEQLAKLTKMVVGAGGVVVVPENSGLLSTAAYSKNIFTSSNVRPSIEYGEHVRRNGFHIMETPTEHWVETVTGLAATGVELIIALVGNRPMQAHPFVPILQMASAPAMLQNYDNDLDLLLVGDPNAWTNQILERSKQIIEHAYTPRLYQQGNIDFQLTRGFLGVSL
ncbi:UxaA family hydrolase [Paenibacillus allorhizosphaerae]|uniref:Galactarate dehydratase (L-threo-forming) n=1 Tax=Paenibacillus allorhizosphaerae TaxID=2849866 RepID=A0ABM8VP52_9BACL|nr:UxaA family hydrolase [Paenibacillus allorhizosphaerae]CAG7652467.1 Galactarate dehydratase (L-threo-forming) [Paenibacillus allorhizosphaerae]